MLNNSIWPIDRTLSGATTLGQSEPGSNDNKEVLCIPQISNITWVSPSDCLVSYPRYLLDVSYLSSEMQSVYSTAPANWANQYCVRRFAVSTERGLDMCNRAYRSSITWKLKTAYYSWQFLAFMIIRQCCILKNYLYYNRKVNEKHGI